MTHLTKRIYLFAIVALAPVLGLAETAIVAPLAKNAKASPDVVNKRLWGQEHKRIRIANSVALGAHDFDALEEFFNKVVNEYDQGKVTGDEFISNSHLVVPLVGQEMALSNMLLWTQKKPNSYAAWYALGRLYCHLAQNARGNKTIKETPVEYLEDSDRYAKLAYDALEKSMTLYSKPLPSYRAAIENATLVRRSSPLNYVETPKNYKTSRHYLEMGAMIDPNSTKIYENYFWRKTPRWGGTYEELYNVLDAAHNKGMNDSTFAKLTSTLLSYQAYDAKTLDLDLKKASQLYERAFDAYPKLESVGLLVLGGKAAVNASEYDSAIRILTRAIAVDPNCYECFFGRGTVYRSNLNNYEKGFSDMATSALQGYLYAQNNIGYYYLTGDHGFPVNLKEAQAWFTLSANQGYDHAKEKLTIVNEKLRQSQ